MGLKLYFAVLCYIIKLTHCQSLLENSFRFIFPPNSTVPNVNYALDKFTAETITVMDLTDCVLECYNSKTCVAVNIGPKDSDGKMTCEIKEFVINQMKYLEERSEFIYFYIEPPAIRKVGCFKHRTRDDRFKLIHNKYRNPAFTSKFPEEDEFKQAIEGCATNAKKLGYSLYGVEFVGECWAVIKGADYARDGTMPDDSIAGCYGGVGVASQAVAVYEILA